MLETLEIYEFLNENKAVSNTDGTEIFVCGEEKS